MSQTFITADKKSFNKKRLLLPVIYLAVLIALWVITPISQLVVPPAVSAESFEAFCNGKYTFLSTTLTNLHYTGYTQTMSGHTRGYYYYTFYDDNCILLLLSPDACKNGTPQLEEITVRVQRLADFKNYDTLTGNLAKDLNWTASGIRNQIPDILLSEPDFKSFTSKLLVGLYFINAAYALADLLKNLYLFVSIHTE